MVIINAALHPMQGAEIVSGYLRTEGTKIAELGPMSAYEPQPGEQVLDAAGGFVTPGLVDAHSHLGMIENALGFEGDDVNEATDPCTPQLRAIDGVNPLDRCFGEALAAGVTTVITAPGSANPVGGQAAAIKTWGRRIDDMILKAPVAMKFALGENPKSCYNDRDETPITRMATAAIIREALFKAREYLEKQERAAADPDVDAPEFDMKCEALLPVLRRQAQAHFHAHRADDIFTAIRIAREFHLDYVIVHGTEGHLVADLLAQEGARVITGPSLGDRGKPELANLSFATPGVLNRAGVLCSICTDHPETPLPYLPLCAALAVKSGMDETEALRAITWYPARIAGLDHRVGSLVPGLDADVVIWSENPLHLSASVRAVMVEGTLVTGGGEQ
jgi:imidazolonepropionase-like amidohydrolase